MTRTAHLFLIGVLVAGCAKHALAPTEPGLPTWDEVPSPHPPGATDAPMPVLVISPDGTCHKRWQSPFLRRSGVRFDPHVEDCASGDLGCGTPIQCPEDAAPLLAELKEAAGADPAR